MPHQQLDGALDYLGAFHPFDERMSQGMEISQPAMSQHLAVLRSAGLVRERRDGRFVNYEVDPEGLVRIGQWLSRYRAYWPRRIDDLRALLKDMDQ